MSLLWTALVIVCAVLIAPALVFIALIFAWAAFDRWACRVSPNYSERAARREAERWAIFRVAGRRACEEARERIQRRLEIRSAKHEG